MYLDALRIRLSLMAMGLVALLTFVALGGRIGPGSRSTVIIDYSIEPRLFEGAEVVIDGESAGLLHLLGSHPRTGFDRAVLGAAVEDATARTPERLD